MFNNKLKVASIIFSQINLLIHLLNSDTLVYTPGLLLQMTPHY